MSNRSEVKNIAIDAELYEQLRLYCDDEGIRLKNFIEDSLEVAMDRHEQYQMLEALKKLQTKIAQVQERSYQHGFHKGVFVSFFLNQGNLRMGLADEALNKQSKVYLEKPVIGPQLTLF